MGRMAIFGVDMMGEDEVCDVSMAGWAMLSEWDKGGKTSSSPRGTVLWVRRARKGRGSAPDARASKTWPAER